MRSKGFRVYFYISCFSFLLISSFRDRIEVHVLERDSSKSGYLELPKAFSCSIVVIKMEILLQWSD